MVDEVHLRSTAVVITERDIEFLALGHYFDREDRVAEHHIVPFDLMRDIIARGGTLVTARPFVVQLPCLHIMDLYMQSKRRFRDAVRDTQLEIKRQHLMVLTSLTGVEAFELPTDVLKHQTHLERGVLGLKMRTHVGSQRKRGIVLIDRIDRLERDTHFEHPAQLPCVHDVNKNIARAKRAAGQVALLVRIFHLAVIQIMNTHREIVGLVGFAFACIGFLDL